MKKKSRRTRPDESESPESPVRPAYTPLSYQPLSTHYVETARKTLAGLAETIQPGDVPDERWYVSATDALMLLLGTGCDAARMTWTPTALAEMRAQIGRLLREGCVIAPGAPAEA